MIIYKWNDVATFKIVKSLTPINFKRQNINSPEMPPKLPDSSHMVMEDKSERHISLFQKDFCELFVVQDVHR